MNLLKNILEWNQPILNHLFYSALSLDEHLHLHNELSPLMICYLYKVYALQFLDPYIVLPVQNLLRELRFIFFHVQ